MHERNQQRGMVPACARDEARAETARPARQEAGVEKPAGSSAHACTDGARPLSPAEADYRAAVLRDIAARVRQDGPHAARQHADRARQFMPFAALKGYRDMARARERTAQPRHELTEEEAAALSRTVGALKARDLVDVVCYEHGAYRTVRGTVAAVDEASRTISVAGRQLAFEDVLSVKRLQ